MSRYVVQAQWSDSPHLSKEAQEELLGTIPAWQRDARSKGIPQLGAGAIFASPESEIVIPQITGGIPSHWPRGYGMDCHWSYTSVAWFAFDPETQIYYLYAEYQRQEAPPSIHAAEIKAKGEWMLGVIDRAADQTEGDGEKLLEMYFKLGLKVVKSDAKKSVASSLDGMLDAMHSGHFKVFETCQKWIREFRIYRRDEKGHIVKKNDHMLDASRYFWADGRSRMKLPPSPSRGMMPPKMPSGSRSWMS